MTRQYLYVEKCLESRHNLVKEKNVILMGAVKSGGRLGRVSSGRSGMDVSANLSVRSNMSSRLSIAADDVLQCQSANELNREPYLGRDIESQIGSEGQS
jgi:hypothetical protein